MLRGPCDTVDLKSVLSTMGSQAAVLRVFLEDLRRTQEQAGTISNMLLTKKSEVEPVAYWSCQRLCYDRSYFLLQGNIPNKPKASRPLPAHNGGSFFLS